MKRVIVICAKLSATVVMQGIRHKARNIWEFVVCDAKNTALNSTENIVSSGIKERLNPNTRQSAAMTNRPVSENNVAARQ